MYGSRSVDWLRFCLFNDFLQLQTYYIYLMLNDLMFENDPLGSGPDFITDHNYHRLWSA